MEDGCCTSCGVPESLAPELFGDSEDSCFVKRQPSTPGEIDRMLRTMVTSELGCIRYAGVSPKIIERLARCSEGQLADAGFPAHIEPSCRDRVGLKVDEPVTPRELAESFVAHCRGLRVERLAEIVRCDEDGCKLRVAWHERNFHSVKIRRARIPEFDWLIVGPATTLYDWLEEAALGEARYFHADDWFSSRSDGSAVAW